MAQRFYDAVVVRAHREGLLSEEHYSVDGMLSEVWASLKGGKPEAVLTVTPSPADPGNSSVDCYWG